MSKNINEKKIFQFIENEDRESISKIAPKIKDKNFFDDDGFTPFMAAMHNHDLKTCQLLKEESFPLEAIDGSGSAILRAIIDEDLKQLEIAIKCGADVNKQLQTQAEVYPLPISINYGNLAFAKKLIELGARTDISCEINASGMTDEFPLSFIAAQTCDFEMFDLILDHSNQFFSKKGLSIFWCLMVTEERRDTDHFKNKAIKLLLDKGFPFNNPNTDAKEHNPTSLLFTQNMEPKERRLREKLILRLIDSGDIKIDYIDQHQNNLLKLSARMGSKKLTKLFLKKGLSPYSQDDQVYTAFHNAATLKDGHEAYQIMNLITNIKLDGISILTDSKNKQGFDIDLKNEDGSSALDLAFMFNNYEAAKLLVDKGAKIPLSTWDRDGEDVPLWSQLVCHICSQEDVDNLIYFIEKGMDITPYKSKKFNFNLSIKCVIGSRILLQENFKTHKGWDMWKGYYDEENAYEKVDLTGLYKKIEHSAKDTSRINKMNLSINMIDSILEDIKA